MAGYDSKHMRVGLSVPGVVPFKLFVYDTADAIATVYAAGYVSNAKKLGMKKGDIVVVRIWTTAPPTTRAELESAAGSANILTAVYLCNVMGISTAGAADLADGTAIAVTNT